MKEEAAKTLFENYSMNRTLIVAEDMANWASMSRWDATRQLLEAVDAQIRTVAQTGGIEVESALYPYPGADLGYVLRDLKARGFQCRIDRVRVLQVSWKGVA